MLVEIKHNDRMKELVRQEYPQAKLWYNIGTGGLLSVDSDVDDPEFYRITSGEYEGKLVAVEDVAIRLSGFRWTR